MGAEGRWVAGGQGQTRNRGLPAALLYGTTSASMAFVNKAVLTHYQFDVPFFILACQMASTVAFVELARAVGRSDIPAYSLMAGKGFALPSALYALHSALSLVALGGMNIPMYGALKRCTPLVSLGLSIVLLGKPTPSTTLLLSVLVITAGCLLAGAGDLSFDWGAYTVGSLSVVAQALYLTLVEQTANTNNVAATTTVNNNRSERQQKPSTTRILQLNAYNTLPLFLCGALLSGEMVQVLAFPGWTDPWFVIVLCVQVCMGSVLNYSLFLCTCLTSALTTSLVGVAKSVLQTALGFFTFGGVPFTALNLTGIILNLVGGCLYTYAKFKEKMNGEGRRSESVHGSHNADGAPTAVHVVGYATRLPVQNATQRLA